MNAPGGLFIEALAVRAGDKELLKPFSLRVDRGEILGVIGPAGSGKSTLLRVLNRLVDLDDGLSVSGTVQLDGANILGPEVDVPSVRKRIGIVFSVQVPLPMSIYDNLAFGPRLAGVTDPGGLGTLMEESLRAAYLWDEVEDRLREPASNLSGGQQQRMCLARTLMLRPEVLLLDEPCSGLDPISTAKIEEALQGLKKRMAVILVTNNVKQASRVADKTAFLLMGELVECGPTQDLFTNPKHKRTEEYITGRFG
ncbi:MAG: phosphate ABC transporter ATP-binding protein [Elusimicrobiota bacterium]